MKSTPRITIAVAVIVSLWVGSTLLVAHANRSEFCPADGRLSPVLDDWEWSRDFANDCEWTLVSGSSRAPESVYKAVGHQPPAHQREVLGWVVPSAGTVPGAAIVTGLTLLAVSGIAVGARRVFGHT